ncbi:hypothetical protein PFISCL1PPCAC_24628, partial [Pristionchus fissidentatus]
GMSYPLYAELYSIGDAVYRRPPYRGAAQQPAELPAGGDTADLYDDDDYEEEYGRNDDGPPCAVDGFAKAEEEKEKVSIVPSTTQSTSHSRAPPGFGAPPGLAPPPGLPAPTASKTKSAPKKTSLLQTVTALARNTPAPQSAAPSKSALKEAVPVKSAYIPKTVAPPVTDTSLPVSTTSDKFESIQDDRVKYDRANNTWMGSIELPTTMHGLLIGREGSNRKKIESGTMCRMDIPERWSKSELIKVTSSVGSENVSRCLDRIEVIKHQKRNGPKTATHFAAIPCNERIVQQRFMSFKDAVLHSSDVDPSCRRASLFPSECKLHLTCCMLQILSNEEKTKLEDVIFRLQEKHTRSRPLDLTIGGFDIMNDNPKDVHILFAKVHGEGIQKLANEIRDELCKAGLDAKYESKDVDVKLHMTLMNSRYAAYEEKAQTHTRDEIRRDDRTPFDATALMKTFEGYEFGTIPLNRITICSLNTEDKTTGYYECLIEARLD